MKYSYVLGPLFLICFFLISLIAVVGIKTIIIAVRLKFSPKKPETIRKKTKTPVKKPRVTKSMEINPDEVDKIYVKRVS